jgi:site-specific DNA recombinase
LDQTTRNVPSLIKAVARADDWVDRIAKGEVRNQRAIAAELGVQKRYVGHIIRLAFLAPDITESILDGKQPPDLNVQKLIPRPPSSWAAQRLRLIPQT